MVHIIIIIIDLLLFLLLLLHRQKRVEMDLVHDDAEQHLIKEVEVIEGALALLVRTREQIVEQIR